MKANEKNDNKPVVQKNNWRSKIKRGILIFLASLSLSSTVTPTTVYAENQNDSYEKMQDDKESFKKSLKVDLNSENKQIIASIIENRGKEFSIETGNDDKVKEVLNNTFKKIDENFEKNASIRGNSAITKEEDKSKFAKLIMNLNDIVFVDLKGPEQNQYTEDLKNRKGAVAFYSYLEIKNDLGIIPANTVVMREGKDLEYTFIHELTHKTQENVNARVYTNYRDIMLMLREGHSNNQAEYVRDTDVDYEGGSIEDYSLSAYHLPTCLYNKLSYFVGENEMDSYMQNPNKTSLPNFLSKQLDPRYGVGTGIQFYEYITKLSIWFDAYSGNISSEKVDKLLEKTNQYNKQVTRNIKEENKATCERILDTNNNTKEFLTRLSSYFENKGYKTLIKKEQKNLLKGLEKLSLNCIQKDIDRITDKEEALTQIQKFDYYKHRCAINKNYGYMTEEYNINEHFKTMRNTQNNLYNKSIDVSAVQMDKKLFDKMLEAQVYDIRKARISYNKKKNKVYIYDKYITNIYNVEKDKKGNTRYDMFDVKLTDDSIPKGKLMIESKAPKQER